MCLLGLRARLTAVVALARGPRLLPSPFPSAAASVATLVAAHVLHLSAAPVEPSNDRFHGRRWHQRAHTDSKGGVLVGSREAGCVVRRALFCDLGSGSGSARSARGQGVRSFGARTRPEFWDRAPRRQRSRMATEPVEEPSAVDTADISNLILIMPAKASSAVARARAGYARIVMAVLTCRP